jgi:hypothetical protein
MKTKELNTWASTIEYIRKHGIFKYLDKWHTLVPPDFLPLHHKSARAYLKKHYPIYAKKIELWEVLHDLTVIEKCDWA